MILDIEIKKKVKMWEILSPSIPGIGKVGDTEPALNITY